MHTSSRKIYRNKLLSKDPAGVDRYISWRHEEKVGAQWETGLP